MRNSPVGGDYIQANSPRDRSELYGALYPTLKVLVETISRASTPLTCSIDLNARYSEAWVGLKQMVHEEQKHSKNDYQECKACKELPRRGNIDTGWLDYVEDWDMPHRGLETQGQRDG